MNAEVNGRAQCGWNNWGKLSRALCDNMISPNAKGNIYKIIVQQTMLYGVETLSMILERLQEEE